MSSSIITGLAILKVNSDYLKKDYLENFVPMLCECLKSLPEDVVALNDLQEQFEAQFGLKLPQNVLKTLLRRLNNYDYLSHEHNVYRIKRDKLNGMQFRIAQSQVVQMYDALIAKLTAFGSQTTGKLWTTGDGEEALHSFLEDWQLRFDWSEGRRVARAETSKETIYIVGSLLKTLEEACAPEFDFFETVVKGHMLANAIYLPDPSQALKKFRETEVYLDTSFLIYALGYAGKPRMEPCVELLQLLIKTGAHLRCFEHTCDEIRGILDACAMRIRTNQLRDSYGPSMEHFITNGCTASDIDLFSAQLERELEALNVRIEPKPDYTPIFMIDELALGNYLSTQLTYRNPQAKDRDVDSISAIVRLRRGRQSSFIEQCRAVFVTSNVRLARACREFFSPDAASRSVSAVVTDQFLTSLLWLKTPTTAPNLPRKRIIADCYAATQPDEHLWQKYLAEIDKLEQRGNVTSQDYYVLRYSPEARTTLMELTHGEEDVFTEGTIVEILEAAHSDIRRETEETLKVERDLRKQAEAEVAAVAQRETLRHKNIVHRAARISHRVFTVLKLVVVLLLAATTVYTFPWALPQPRTAWLRYLLALLEGALLAMSVANLMFGTAVNEWLQQWELAFSAWVETRLWNLYSPAGDEAE